MISRVELQDKGCADRVVYCVYKMLPYSHTGKCSLLTLLQRLMEISLDLTRTKLARFSSSEHSYETRLLINVFSFHEK
jgi:hypothetical protein